MRTSRRLRAGSSAAVSSSVGAVSLGAVRRCAIRNIGVDKPGRHATVSPRTWSIDYTVRPDPQRAPAARETLTLERRDPALPYRRPDRRRIPRPTRRRIRGRDPRPRLLGDHRRAARPNGPHPDDPGDARAVGRPPSGRLLPGERPADACLHEHRAGRDEHRRRDGHRVRRLDGGPAHHRLAPHLHARPRPPPGARAPPSRRQPAGLRAGRQGVVAAVARRRPAVRPPPGLERDALRPARARSSSTCRWTSRRRPPRSSCPDPERREARGRVRPAADDVERAAKLLAIGASGRSSSPAAARSCPRPGRRSRPSPSDSGRRS